MEEEAPAKRSVAELAGRFKGSAPPQNAAGNGADKPVRRRPPRTLQLPKPQEEDQEPPGVTSPLPAKAKRNSALIEKLQANLALSPSAPSPKSPGFRLLPPSFPPASPGSAPVTTVPASPLATPASPVTPVTEEEGPASFEAPPTAAEGSILSSINKGRPRHSIRRRPPSRRHRKSSCEDDVGVAGDDATETQPEEKTTGDGQEGPTDVSTPAEGHQTHEEDKTKSKAKDEDETKSKAKDEDETKSKAKDEDETKSKAKEDEDETKSKAKEDEDETKSKAKDEDETKSSSEVKEDEDRSSSHQEEEEKKDSAEEETKTDDRKEEEKEEATSSAR